jgi:hypothetical protein
MPTTSVSEFGEETILFSLTTAGSASNVRKTIYKHIKSAAFIKIAGVPIYGLCRGHFG